MTPEPASDDALLTVSQVATITRYSDAQIVGAIRAGVFPAYRSSPRGMHWIMLGDLRPVFRLTMAGDVYPPPTRHKPPIKLLKVDPDRNEDGAVIRAGSV